MIREKQRTKTGCLTCRRRKKKCGEEIPICYRCSASGQICTWPSESDLFDRRSRLVRQKGPLVQFERPARSQNISWPEYPIPHASAASSMEHELLHHFLHNFLPGLVSLSWDRTLFMEYQDHVMDLIMNNPGVKHAVLASSASNLSMLTSNIRYENFALGCYSRAVNEVNCALTEISSKNLMPNDALLVAVIYLCIHDSWGKGLGNDPSTHIIGAMALINIRLDQNASSMSMTRVMDRVAMESMAFQGFMLSMKSLFTPKPFFDGRFVSRTETLLVNGISPSSSPILILPLPLYQLLWSLIQLCSEAIDPTENAINRIALDLKRWENSALQQDMATADSKPGDDCYTSFQSLYVLSASILFGWITGEITLPLTVQLPTITTPIDMNSLSSKTQLWQMKHALAILKQRDIFEPWTKTYLAVWPLLIFGLASSSQQEEDFIRDTLIGIRNRTGFGITQNILQDLEYEWRVKSQV